MLEIFILLFSLLLCIKSIFFPIIILKILMLKRTGFLEKTVTLMNKMKKI